MKLEVGMYVRTDLGEIGKVTSVSDNLSDLGIRAIAYNSEPCLKGREIKVSHNIIDLIEVGDIVILINGMKKEELMLIKDLVKQKPILETHKIISIVTKEQFEAIQYKVV